MGIPQIPPDHTPHSQPVMHFKRTVDHMQCRKKKQTPKRKRPCRQPYLKQSF